MKLTIRVISGILLFSLLSYGCDSVDPDTTAVIPPEHLVAAEMIAVEQDTAFMRIVLFDIRDPSIYRTVDLGEANIGHPHLNPQKSKLLFGSSELGAIGADQFYVYDLELDTSTALFHDPGSQFELLAELYPIFWNPDGTGFYYATPTEAWTPRRDVMYYDIAQGAPPKQIKEGYGIIPVGLKSSDTLLVVSSEEQLGIYYMDAQSGEVLAPVENPHLEYSFTNDIPGPIRQPYSLSWSQERQLFAFSLGDTTFQARKIVVTDLKGEVYEEYTDGNQYDDFPEWGPGNTLLFQRRYRWESERYTQLMQIDIESRKVSQVVDPVVFGATGLRFPSY